MGSLIIGLIFIGGASLIAYILMKATENNPSPKPKPEPDNSPISCPKCGSTQITAVKKGFGLGKAAVGGLLTGGIGLLGGFIGSGKVKIVCLKCGHEWQPK
jgi:tellurium resistance protein TerD